MLVHHTIILCMWIVATCSSYVRWYKIVCTYMYVHQEDVERVLLYGQTSTSKLNDPPLYHIKG